MAAAMEKAIEDGVDVLSVSIGSPDFHTPYYSEPIAIAAFAAADRGIFVACSAGNDGPSPSQIVNTAPWITTVGAGSLDRTFQCNSGWGTARFTWEILSTVKSNVMGKIVVSKGAGVDDGFLIQEAGGVALVGLSWKEIREGTTAQDFPLPSLSVGYREGLEISSYINTTNGSTANIMSQAQTVLGKLRAPMVAASSA